MLSKLCKYMIKPYEWGMKTYCLFFSMDNTDLTYRGRIWYNVYGE